MQADGRSSLDELCREAEQLIVRFMADVGWTDADLDRFEELGLDLQTPPPNPPPPSGQVYPASQADVPKRASSTTRGGESAVTSPSGAPSLAPSFWAGLGLSAKELTRAIAHHAERGQDATAPHGDAQPRDFKRRRTSYRAKRTFITKRTPLQIQRDIIGDTLLELATKHGVEVVGLRECLQDTTMMKYPDLAHALHLQRDPVKSAAIRALQQGTDEGEEGSEEGDDRIGAYAQRRPTGGGRGED